MLEHNSSIAVTMKSSFTLVAILAIIGLAQAHQFPNFGEGPLHEDIQDFLDLIPGKEIGRIFKYYLAHDPEMQDVVKYLTTSSLIKNYLTEFQAIPEVLNLFNYLQKENINIYDVMNKVNKNLGIKELEPPKIDLFIPMPMLYRNTDGIKGFLKEVKYLFNYDDLITTYARKLKSSPAFVDFINQIKSDNFQQIVNKVHEIKSYQIILNTLKNSGVKVHIIADIMLAVFGITVPNPAPDRTLLEEFQDFYDLLPIEEFLNVVLTYLNDDEQVNSAFLYMFTPEFHTLLRNVEALDEHKALVVYFEKAGVNIIKGLQELHKAIGMEDYVPPEIEGLLKSPVGMLKVGGGMQAMLKDLYDLLPLGLIDALYRIKLKTSKVFYEFIQKLGSPELQKIITNLYVNETYKNFIVETREKGLDFHGLTKLANRIFGLEFPY